MLTEELALKPKTTSNYASPLRNDAFDLDDDTKISLITSHFQNILEVLGLDLNDDSLKDTPKRIAKMYVTEFFSGLNPANKPIATLFENPYQYDEMLIEKISRYSATASTILYPL